MARGPFSTLDSGFLSQGESGCRRGHLSRSRGSERKTRAGMSAEYSSWTSTAPKTILLMAPGCTSQSIVRSREQVVKGGAQHDGDLWLGGGRRGRLMALPC